MIETEERGGDTIIIDFSVNIVSFVMSIIEWSIIGYLAYRVYKRLETKPKVWKVVFATFVGVFSFSINMEWFHTLVSVPILPIGVWILNGALGSREDRWNTYRRFAWIGFFSNFIFLAGTLITILIHPLIYPDNELSTYIKATDEASIITIHPAGEGRTLDQEKLMNQLPSMERVQFNSAFWYEEMYLESGSMKNKDERFPYQLIGTTPKWGFGHEPDVYMERDGKGILISTPKTQYYFRSPETVIEEVEG